MIIELSIKEPLFVHHLSVFFCVLRASKIRSPAKKNCANLGAGTPMFKRPGSARFELQIVDVPHGQEDFIDGDGLSLKSNMAPISCKVCLPMIRSYNSGGPPSGYSTISGCRCTFLLAEY